MIIPTQFLRRLVVFSCSWCKVQKVCCVLYRPSLCKSEEVSLGDALDTHGPTFSPCSEPPRSLARQLHFAAIPQRHSFRTPNCVCHFFELHAASMILSRFVHLFAQKSAHVTQLEVFCSDFHRVLFWTSSWDNSCRHPLVFKQLVNQHRKSTFVHHKTFD